MPRKCDCGGDAPYTGAGIYCCPRCQAMWRSYPNLAQTSTPLRVPRKKPLLQRLFWWLSK